MSTDTDRSGVVPSTSQRVQAIVALVCSALLVVVVAVAVLRNPAMLVVAILGLFLAGWGGWWVVTERMPRRAIGIVVAAGGVVLIGIGLVKGVTNSDTAILVGVLALILFAAAASQARLALAQGLHAGDVVMAERPRHPVLIANPKSGGGKVEKFHLIDRAREQGVEVVLLQPGDDLEQLARDAVARGADCLGMAGGDGSQALVASVASELDLPFVCISAGTRNHFALDLGLDREDPAAGLIAFTEAVERSIDYATIHAGDEDRLFVNNASMGVYATIVQEEGYRDAKRQTSMELLPTMLGNADRPFDLQFTTPDGTEVDGAFVILVSNNPYVLGPQLDVSQRRSLTTGELGVFAITATTGAEAAALVTRTAIGLGKRDPNLHEFTTPHFEVRSRSGSVFVGVDGEALELPAPLTFRIQPGGLRIRVPADSRQRLARRQSRNITLATLLDIARGRPARVG
ncbi:MAG: diacylglycerol kinase family protein [Candidatus Nanopelagicales bacterium]